MQDEDKTKEQLIAEFCALREQVAGFEKERVERKKAEKALRESEARLSAILEQLPVAVGVHNRNGEFILCNSAMHYYVLRKIPSRDSEQKGRWKAFGADGHPLPPEQWPGARALRGEIVNPGIECQYTAEDSREVWTLVSAVPYLSAGGESDGVIVVIQGITERKRAEEELRRREEELRVLVENAPDVISLFDRNLRRIYVNSEVWENTGQDSSFMMGKSLTEAGYPDSFAQPLNAALQNVFATGREETVELDWEAPKGRIWLQIRCAPLRTADGSVERVMSIGRDITERKEVEEALRQARDDLEIRVQERTAELEEANRILLDKERTLRSLSNRILSAHEEERKRISRELHDSISSSLTAIKLSLENSLSQSKELSGPLSNSLKILVASLSETIDETRRIMSDLRPSVLDDLGLVTAIEWFCRKFRTTYSNIHIEQLLEIDRKRMPEPLKIAVFRIIQEALQNIAKHSRAEFVDVILKENAGQIELLIEDNGIGFDPEAILAREQGGLGLSIMRERTELSGGSFEIKSIAGKGTAIRALWPFD